MSINSIPVNFVVSNELKKHECIEIVVDHREDQFYDKIQEMIQSKENCPITVRKQNLALGDIILCFPERKEIAEEIVCMIERKTFLDLLASIKDGRYEEQSHRLMYSMEIPRHQIVYLLEGMMSQIPSFHKQTVFSAITSLNLFKGFSVLRTVNLLESVELVVGMALKIHKNRKDGKQIYSTPNSNPNIQTDRMNIEQIPRNNTCIPEPYETVIKRVKKDNVTTSNIMHIMLCQIPGISDVISTVIVAKYKSISSLIQQLQIDDSILHGLQYEHNGKLRKISKTALENICTFLICN